MPTTKIGERDVPIRPGAKTTLVFSAVAFDFWTLTIAGFGQQTGRCPAGQDPGERWRRMEGMKGYEKYFDSAKAYAEYLRPAAAMEVAQWLNQHPKDAQFVESCEVAGQGMKLSSRNGRVELEPM